MDILQVLLWSTIGSIVSLVGGFMLIGAAKTREIVVRYALPFGAGALLAAAFLSTLPEALHDQEEPIGMLMWALGGFLVFFLLERFLGWFHHHHHDEAHGDVRHKTHTSLVIVGDTLHNAIDGIAIGAAFLVNPAAGITTALAVAAHEIPQEIGDFGILLGKGMKPRRVILVNIVSAVATIVAALAVYSLGQAVAIDSAPLLALAAGFFIYIAASDIVPDIHEKPRHEGNRQAVMLLVGVAVIALVVTLLPHSHEAGHDDTDHAEVSRIEDAEHTH